jgi:hypothetical protein
LQADNHNAVFCLDLLFFTALQPVQAARLLAVDCNDSYSHVDVGVKS